MNFCDALPEIFFQPYMGILDELESQFSCGFDYFNLVFGQVMYELRSTRLAFVACRFEHMRVVFEQPDHEIRGEPWF
jgi:hypothetical protein